MNFKGILNIKSITKAILIASATTIAFSAPALADEINTDGLYVGDYSGNDTFINGRNSGNYGIVNDSTIDVRNFDNGDNGATGEIQSLADITVTRNFKNADGNDSIGIISGGTIDVGRDFTAADDDRGESYISGGTITVGRDFNNGEDVDTFAIISGGTIVAGDDFNNARGNNAVAEITGGTITLEDEFRNGYEGSGATGTVSGGTITVNSSDFWNGYYEDTTGIVSGGTINVLNGDFENSYNDGSDAIGLVTGGTINTGDDFHNHGEFATIDTASNLTLNAVGNIENYADATIINNATYTMDITATDVNNNSSFTNSGNLISSAVFNNNDVFLNTSTGITTHTGNFINNDDFQNDGTFTISGEFDNEQDFTNTGTINFNGDLDNIGSGSFVNTGNINFSGGNILGSMPASGNWNMTGNTNVTGNWTQTGSLALLASGVSNIPSLEVVGTFTANTGSSLNLDVINVNPISTTNYDIVRAGLLNGTGLANFISTVNLTNTGGSYIYDFAQNTNDLVLTVIAAPVGGIDLSDLTFTNDHYVSDVNYLGEPAELNDDVNGDLVIDILDNVYNELDTTKVINTSFTTTANQDFTIVAGEELDNEGTLNTNGTLYNYGVLLNEGIINLEGDFVGGVGNTFSNVLGTVNVNDLNDGTVSISGLTSAAGIWNINGDADIIGVGNKVITGAVNVALGATLSMAGDLDNQGTFSNLGIVDWQGGEIKGINDFQGQWNFEEDTRLDENVLKTNNGAMNLSNDKTFDVEGDFINAVASGLSFGIDSTANFLGDFTNNGSVIDNGSTLTFRNDVILNSSVSLDATTVASIGNDLTINNPAVLTNVGDLSIGGDIAGDVLTVAGSIDNAGTITTNGAEIFDIQYFNGEWNINSGEVSQLGAAGVTELIAEADSIINLGDNSVSQDTFVNGSENGSIGIKLENDVLMNIGDDAVVTSTVVGAGSSTGIQMLGDSSDLFLNDTQIITNGDTTKGVVIDGNQNHLIINGTNLVNNVILSTGDNTVAVEINGDNTIFDISCRAEAVGADSRNILMNGGSSIVNFLVNSEAAFGAIENTSAATQYLTFGYLKNPDGTTDYTSTEDGDLFNLNSSVLNTGGGNIDTYVADGAINFEADQINLRNLFIGADNFTNTTILAGENAQTIDEVTGVHAIVEMKDSSTNMTVSNDIEISDGSTLIGDGTLTVGGQINNLGTIEVSSGNTFNTDVSTIVGGGDFDNNGTWNLLSPTNITGDYNQSGTLELFVETDYIISGGTSTDAALDVTGTATFDPAANFIMDLSHLDENDAINPYINEYNIIRAGTLSGHGAILNNTTFLGSNPATYNYVFQQGTGENLVLDISATNLTGEVWIAPITLANDYVSDTLYTLPGGTNFNDGHGVGDEIDNTQSTFKLIKTGDTTTAQGDFTIVNGDTLTNNGTLVISGDGTTLLNQGSIFNNYGIIISGDNTTFETEAGTVFDNTNGSVDVTGDNVTIDGISIYSGNWLFTGGASTTISEVASGITVLNTASISNAVNSELTIEGDFNNLGTFTNAGVINFEGKLGGAGILGGVNTFEGARWNINGDAVLGSGDKTIDGSLPTIFDLSASLSLNGGLINEGTLIDDSATGDYISTDKLDNVVEVENAGTLNLIGDFDITDNFYPDSDLDIIGFDFFNSGILNYGGGEVSNLINVTGIWNIQGDTDFTDSTIYNFLGDVVVSNESTVTADTSVSLVGSLTMGTGTSIDITEDFLNGGVFVNNGTATPGEETTINVGRDFVSNTAFENSAGGTMNVGRDFTQNTNTYTNNGTLNVSGTSLDFVGGGIANLNGTVNSLNTMGTTTVSGVTNFEGVWNFADHTEFDNAGTPIIISGDVSVDATEFQSFENLTINSTGSLTMGADTLLLMDGDFTNDGTFVNNGVSLIDVLGDFTSSEDFETADGSLLFVGGNFSQTGGTFTNNGEVAVEVVGNALIDTGAIVDNTSGHFDFGGDLTVNGAWNNGPNGEVHMLGVNGTISGLEQFDGEWLFEESTTIDNNATFTGQTDVITGGTGLTVNGDVVFDGSTFTFTYDTDDITNDIIKITADNMTATNDPTFLINFLPSAYPEEGDSVQLFDISGTANDDYVVSLVTSIAGLAPSYDYDTYLLTFDVITENIAPSYGATVSATFNTHSRISTTVKNRLRKLGLSSGDLPEKHYGIWGDFEGGTSKQDSRKGSDGYDTDYYGLTFGADFEVDLHTELGVAFNYSDTDVDGRDDSTGDNTEIDTYSLIGYGSHDFPDRLILEGQASLSYSDYDSVRDLTDVAAGFAYGDYDAYVYGLESRLSKEYSLENKMIIAPTVGLSYYHADLDSYSETGSTSGINVNSEKYDSLVSHLGAEVNFADYEAGEDWTLSSRLHAFWDHEFIIDEYDAGASYIGSSTSFSTKGLKPAPNSFNVGGEIGLYNTNDWEFSLSYDADIKEDYLGHRGKLRIRKDF